MEVEISMLVEIGVDSHRHVVANAHDSSEGVGAQAQVCELAHVLERLSLLLHRIVVSAQAVDFNLVSLYLHGLSLSLAFHQCSYDADAGARSNLLEQIVIDLRWVDYYLYIINSRTIVEGDKIYRFATAMGSHPSLDIHDCAEVPELQDIDNLSSFHTVDNYLL